MPVSDKLAYEIFIILLFHIPAILILFSFCTYLYLKAKKTPVLLSFLSLAAMLLIWMISKVLKTVSPNESIRWFFIVTQYFGVQFIGYTLFIFAYIYAKNKIPKRSLLFVLAFLPTLSFLAVLTNPLHMQFYSYYDFYKDRFGRLFIPIQSIQYLYLLAGILMLSKNYTKQPAFKNRQHWSFLFAAVTLIPLFANVYYILFKLNLFRWIFPFPVFDFSPIAGTIALILFTIPALYFRFFDISPISHQQIFDQMPTGIVFVTKKELLYSPNFAFQNYFGLQLEVPTLSCLKRFICTKSNNTDFTSFYKSGSSTAFLLELQPHRYFQVRQRFIGGQNRMLSFSDVSLIMHLRQDLHKQHLELVTINHELKSLSGKSAELSAARIKSAVAQNIHDILGHSLTIALCTVDLSIRNQMEHSFSENLFLIQELLNRSLEDLRNAVTGNPLNLHETSLTKAIQQLSNPNISVHFISQGTPYELCNLKTEAIFRICQEAITNSIRHGHAEKIHIFLRFFPEKVELFIIDDGIGCKQIKKNFGLTGMETRIAELNGYICFGSDGTQGFHIHVKLD